MTIVRTPSRVTGGITAAEKVALDAHAAKWIANAMSTEPVVPHRLVPAIHALYAAAALPRPRVVIVSSPIVMAFAGGFAAAIWWARKNGAQALRDRLAWDVATSDATHDATGGATYGATSVATSVATRDATDDATHDATRDATDGATSDATYGATYGATSDATSVATYGATRVATRDATDDATDGATYGATYGATSDATSVATYGATSDATSVATRDATDDATHDATHVATDGATYGATRDATSDATSDATYGATSVATRDATDDATYGATYGATSDATRVATAGAFGPDVFIATARKLSHEFCVDYKFMLQCAKSWWRMYQGGNMWSAWPCYLSAFRDVLGLRLPEHEKFKAWESCAVEGGFRIMHEEFCIVSDRPEVLKVDAQNRPHCADGPSHRWRDGWSLYHWHGLRIPEGQEYIIISPEMITVADIEAERNAEIRRVMTDRYGPARYAVDSGAKVVHELPADHRLVGLRTAKLLRKEVPAPDEPIICVDLLNSTPEPDGTVKRYTLRVDPNAYDGEASQNCHAAAASTWRNADGSLTYANWRDYAPAAES